MGAHNSLNARRCPRAYHGRCLSGWPGEDDEWACSRCTPPPDGVDGCDPIAGPYSDGPLALPDIDALDNAAGASSSASGASGVSGVSGMGDKDGSPEGEALVRALASVASALRGHDLAHFFTTPVAEVPTL